MSAMEAFERFREACAALWAEVVAEFYRLVNRDGYR